MPNKIIIEGVIGWEVTPSDVRRQLNRFDGKDVDVFINSPGGFIDDGIQIYNDIAKHTGHVTTIITSLAASMGSYIALAGDTRKAHSNATFMIHNALTIMWGNHHDFRHEADILEGLSNVISNEYVNVTGKTSEEIHAWMDAGNGAGSYFFGEEIKEAGFVDEIIQSKNKKEDSTKAVALARYNFAEAMKIVKSNPEPADNIQRAAAIAGVVTTINKTAATGQTTIPESVLLELNNAINNPQSQNQNQQEQQERKLMNLAQLLAENPTAKIEHDAIVAEAKAEAVKAEKSESSARMESVKTYLTKDSLALYPESIGAIVDVIEGTGNVSAVTSAMAFTDRINEMQKSNDAQNETNGQGGTPGQQPGGSGITDEGDIVNEVGMKAVSDRLAGK